MFKIALVQPFLHVVGHFRGYIINLCKGVPPKWAKDTCIVVSYSDQDLLEVCEKKGIRVFVCSKYAKKHIPMFSKLANSYHCINFARKITDRIICLDHSFIISALFSLSLGERLVQTFPGVPAGIKDINKVLYIIDAIGLRLSQKGSLIIVHSKVSNNVLANVFKKKGIIIPWGVEKCEPVRQIEATPSGVEGLKNFFLCFGVIESRKNIEFVIDVFTTQLKNKILVVAGPSKNPYYLKVLKKRTSKSSNIVFVSKFLNENEKGWLLSNSCAVILNYGPEFKGASGVFAESTAFGIPVLHSAVASLEEDSQMFGNGVAFEFGNIDDFVAKCHAIDSGQKLLFKDVMNWSEVFLALTRV